MASSCYEFARICSTKVTLCPSASSGPAPAVRSIQRHHLGLEVGALRQLRVDRVIGAGAGAAQDTGRAVGLGDRSEGRRVGKECVSTCRSLGWPYQSKKKHQLSSKSAST